MLNFATIWRPYPKTALSTMLFRICCRKAPKLTDFFPPRDGFSQSEFYVHPVNVITEKPPSLFSLPSSLFCATWSLASLPCLLALATRASCRRTQMIYQYYLSLNLFFSRIDYSCSKGFKEEHCKVFSNTSLLGVLSYLSVV